MDEKTIIALILGLEQFAANLYRIIQTAGLSVDVKQAYLDRIAAALADVPEPKVGE